MHEHGSWGFAEGDEIATDRHAVRLLGGGRRYEAYLAWDDALHALAVVKILRPRLVSSAEARAAIEGEARMLSLLAHPSLVRMFDATLEGERPHLLLEYLDGPRLSTLARRYGVIVEQLLPLALELCSALHYVHGRGVVHLDVKPRNIVMSARPKLIDLSVAMTLPELERIRQPVGTDAYMAPEQCDPARFSDIGPPADIWGVGVTLYEALSSVRPFPAPAPDHGELTARYPQLAHDPAPLARDVPLALSDLVLACLEAVPANRPTAAELADSLEPLTAGLPGPRLGLFRPGGRTHVSEYAAGDESILRGVSRRSHRARVLLSGVSQREGGTR